MAMVLRRRIAIGGMPRLVVPVNAEVAVIRACWYEPRVNRTYAEMAALTAPLCWQPGPAGRATKPRSKPALTDRRAPALRPPAQPPLLQTRTERGEAAQRGGTDPTPRDHPPAAFPRTRSPSGSSRCRGEPYVCAEWHVRQVGIDYHVEGHLYSVPYCFARTEVEVRLTVRPSRSSSANAGARGRAGLRQDWESRRCRSWSIPMSFRSRACRAARPVSMFAIRAKVAR
jgi:hypothetical protein